VPGRLTLVRREFSAGGVVVRVHEDAWELAVIRPGGRTKVWALPKGNLGPGEPPAEAAAREVTEETGLVGDLVTKLGDVRYTYTWKGERVFKIVSFYLFRHVSGELGAIAPEHAHEVAETRWLRLDVAASQLTYAGEKQVARKARDLLGPVPHPL
jgi:8-oxo-dGTP pyrophosphatase MutT (NUDIX family)